MPTQKTFKGRVRARMTKTGESYTAARRQLLNKAADPVEPLSADSAGRIPPPSRARPATRSASPTMRWSARPASVMPSGSPSSTHGARPSTGTPRSPGWLSETHGVPGWWTQSVTVAYERARGMRARHQMRDGFSVSATRTVGVAADRALEAFTSASLRERWLPNAPMHQRPTRAALSARFDWSDPPSRVIVTVVPKGADKTVVAVAHEQLPDAEAGERQKAAWREWLGALKTVLEGH